MNIKFYIPKNDPGGRASRRFRALVPLKGMRKQDGIIGDLNNATIDDIIVMAKKTKKSEVDFLVKKKIKFVFDVCDDKWPREKELYDYASKYANKIITTTPELAKQIKSYTNKEAIIIDDPTERDREEPKFNPNKIIKIAHYGAGKAFPEQHWESIVDNLGKNVEFHFTIGRYAKFRKPYEDFKNMAFYEWSYEKQGDIVRNSDIVLIPIRAYSQNVLFKSPNRIIDALQQGRIVITNPGVASYEKLKDFVIWNTDRNFKSSLEWALNNKDQVIEKIKKGQEYIKLNHSPEAIGKKWVELENKI